MIVLFGKNKRRVMRAISWMIINCTTNNNGKTALNHTAMNAYGVTLTDLDALKKIGHRFNRKLKKQALKKKKNGKAK